jgi:(S)-ureidoglycine aminohydrolase
VTAFQAARAIVIEKPCISDGPLRPGSFTGLESEITGQPLGGDPDLEVRPLIPAKASFDFAVNTMIFRRGAALSMVEVHVMEHGLLFLQGGGIYRLGDYSTWRPAVHSGLTRSGRRRRST